METFGDKLYSRVSNARHNLFLQGEIAQLTYQAFVKYMELIDGTEDDKIQITYPIGYKPDHTTIDTTQTYTKEELKDRYQHLGLRQLPINSIYQLITTIEALFFDILRDILIQFPVKIPNKKKFDVEILLEAKSLDEIKLNLINVIINEIAYKSPKEFAEEFNKYVGVNLLEKPAFHRYIELKATRDIYIHNQGIANEIYLSKADSSARVKSGEFLPVDIQYFLQSYESCIQITEILEEALNKIWPSIIYQRNKTPIATEQQEVLVEAVEEAKEQSIVEPKKILLKSSKQKGKLLMKSKKKQTDK